jgi:hypothetical protein
MNRVWTGVACTLLAAGCGKVQEAASEKVAEKAIEAAASKDGVKAKVDLSGGQMQMTTTDAQGKTTTMQLGGAQVGEADVGVPFYPGAKPVEGGSTRVTTNDGTMASVTLHSDDPADKVAAFYRDQMKSKAAGKQLMDMSGNGNATLALVDDASKQSLQVHVNPAERGTDILITASRGPAK